MSSAVASPIAPARQGVLDDYRASWAIPAVRHALVLGAVCRVPMFAMTVLFTLHVVQHVTPSYSRAGLITGAMTVAMGISAPWRGRLLDVRGLRRTMLPSLLVLTPIYVGLALVTHYWLLLGLAVVAGIMAFPVHSVIRQVVIGNSPLAVRKSALALDGVITELSYVIGPALAIWLGTAWSTRWTVLLCGMLYVAGAAAVTWVNPPIVDLHAATEGDAPAARWLTLRVLGVLLATVGIGFVISGTDLGVIAALRDMGHESWIGWVLAGWGLSSAVAGVLYGLLPRPLRVRWLLMLLGVLTIPMMFATNAVAFGLLLMLAGVACAPALVSSVDSLQQEVTARARGQAMGWQGTAMTAGSALAPPTVGAVLDQHGWQTGYLVTGMAGIGCALVLWLIVTLRARPRLSMSALPLRPRR